MSKLAEVLAKLDEIRDTKDWPGCMPHTPAFVDGCDRCLNVATMSGKGPAPRTDLVAALREARSVMMDLVCEYLSHSGHECSSQTYCSVRQAVRGMEHMLGREAVRIAMLPPAERP